MIKLPQNFLLTLFVICIAIAAIEIPFIHLNYNNPEFFWHCQTFFSVIVLAGLSFAIYRRNGGLRLAKAIIVVPILFVTIVMFTLILIRIDFIWDQGVVPILDLITPLMGLVLWVVIGVAEKNKGSKLLGY